jgi:hypothetical protein
MRYANAAPPTRDNKIMVVESQPGGPSFLSGKSAVAASLKSSVCGRASGIGASGGSRVSEG